MAEAQVSNMKKKQSIPTKRYESEVFTVKNKTKTKRRYVHKESFKTKNALREEIESLKKNCKPTS